MNTQINFHKDQQVFTAQYSSGKWTIVDLDSLFQYLPQSITTTITAESKDQQVLTMTFDSVNPFSSDYPFVLLYSVRAGKMPAFKMADSEINKFDECFSDYLVLLEKGRDENYVDDFVISEKELTNSK